MAATYTPIASITLGASTSSIVFSSIPQTYTDLIIVTNLVSAAGNQDLDLRFNGDTGTNYSWTALYGTGSAAASTRGTSDNKFRADQYGYIETTLRQNAIIQIQNYSNTTTYKTAISRANNASTGVDIVVGLWRSTAAISSITFVNNLASGSTFNLYGILGANA
jgi:hypothetical protein